MSKKCPEKLGIDNTFETGLLTRKINEIIDFLGTGYSPEKNLKEIARDALFEIEKEKYIPKPETLEGR